MTILSEKRKGRQFRRPQIADEPHHFWWGLFFEFAFMGDPSEHRRAVDIGSGVGGGPIGSSAA
ncbi:MAG TPA: hypothetical protein VGG04_16105, partial [Candidatus Sulfotelmatobacter sp.]